MNAGLDNAALWPDVGQNDKTTLHFEKWEHAVASLPACEDRTFAAHLAETASGRAMLSCIFGASPFLSDCLIREPGFVRRLWEEGPNACVAASLSSLSTLPPADGVAMAPRLLRVERRRVALSAALADIAGHWELEDVTRAISDLADASAGLALRILLTRLAGRGLLSLPDSENPESGSGLIALALGKLGGRELNYSSDIDLILLFDPDIMPARDRAEITRHLVRLARNFNAMLSEITADGYAFRVDLRLRPDPSATPLVMSTEAAEHYYEARGQTWERAALIKARPMAGDLQAGADFLKRIEPFVWRRHLDFATIQDLHGMKRKIDEHHKFGGIQALGHNLKLGRGGIREIEFFAQTQQLIWGGRDPRLRVIPTCDVIRELSRLGKLPINTANAFVECYRYLRRAEHRVQMVDDEQTHSLPDDPQEFASMARFLGYAGADEFTADLVVRLREVERHYADFFELPEELTQSGGQPVFADLQDPEMPARLRRLGFRDPDSVIGILEAWSSGRYRVAQSGQSQAQLMGLAPLLLTAMSGTTDPDLAMRRFDRLLSRLPMGLQIFALLKANLAIMDTLAELLVSAPALAELIEERPALFDALIEMPDASASASRNDLEEELSRYVGSETDPEEVAFRVGRWVDSSRFRSGVSMLYQRTDPLDAARHLSDIADCALRMLLLHIATAFSRRHGIVPGAEMAILSLGKLGSREMSITSDLDLILIYDAPEDAVSDGERPLPATSYYNRLLRRLLAGLGARPGQRQIYEIDMRLRPSGNAGPLATSVDAFIRYHRDSAWTWEKMALTRARVSAGPLDISCRLEEIIRNTLCETRDPDALRTDVADMRVRMDGEFHTENIWSVKHHRGGLVDIEFIAQYLALLHASPSPEVLRGNTGETLRSLEACGALRAEDALQLVESWEFWTRLQALQRVIKDDAGAEDIPTGIRPLFQRLAGVTEFGDVEGRMAEMANDTKAIYDRLLGQTTQA